MSEQSQRQIIVKKIRRRKSGTRRRLLTDAVLLLLMAALLLIRSDAEAKPERTSVAQVGDYQQFAHTQWPSAENAENRPVFVWGRDSVGAMPSTFPGSNETPPAVMIAPPALREFAQISPIPDARLPIPIPTRVPEPGTIALLLCSGSAMMLRRRRARRA